MIALSKLFDVVWLFTICYIMKVDDLEEVSEYYQNKGCFNELISLMESGLGLEYLYWVGSFICKILFVWTILLPNAYSFKFSILFDEITNWFQMLLSNNIACCLDFLFLAWPPQISFLFFFNANILLKTELSTSCASLSVNRNYKKD